MSSCKEDVEIWDSNTLGYSGTYFWQLYSENGEDLYTDYDNDVQLMIYNTAANAENEVWIEDLDGQFPLKSKFSFTGNSESFTSKTTDFASLENNVSAIEVPGADPTALNEATTEDREYIRAYVLDGKILPSAATTISGSAVDSIYIKLTLLSGTVSFKSYSVPVDKRKDPEVEQFEWKYESATYDNTLDESYIISGHRKTGFPEDDH
ncbi:MAG: hypothetical protein COB98_05765 [Flavobacteriaceae bacterium]|nr:MAG: hypothetical protein COB98_05765 [Flavobacteriaceae bacterium]